LYSGFFSVDIFQRPIGAITAIATALTVILLLVQKKSNIKGAIFALTVAGVFFALYKYFFSRGAATSMNLSVSGTLSKGVFAPVIRKLFPYGNRNEHFFICFLLMAAHTFLMAPFQAFLYGIRFVKDIKNLLNLDGESLICHSCLAGGFLAFYIFDHYAMSQVYFAFLGLFFLHLLAVGEIDSLKNKKHLKYLGRALATVGILTMGIMYVNFCGSGLRAFLKNIGVTPKYQYSAMVTAEDEESMKFLQKHSDKTAVFATNRIDTSPYSNDGISNIYSAFSARQAYMEGYAYALTNMGVPYYVVEQRQKINAAVFNSETSPRQLKHIVETAGITHIVYSAQFSGSTEILEKTFEKIYDRGSVKIYATNAQPFSPHNLYEDGLREYGQKPTDKQK
jgi:hypothetical protein